jgi:hypothetical protein
MASPGPEKESGTVSEHIPVHGLAKSEPRWLPSQGVDRKTGRAIPISDEEWQQRMVALEHELAEIDAQDDTPEEVYVQFLRAIDKERRRQGRPPAFQGYY